MRCVVFEPITTGHHFKYLRHLVPACADLASEVIVVTACDAQESEVYRECLGPFASRITIDPAVPKLTGLSSFARCRTQFAGIRYAVRRHRPDHVFVPSADGVSQVMGIARLCGVNPFRGRIEAEGMILRGRFAYPAATIRSAIVARLSLAAMASAPWTIAHHLDPLPLEALRRSGGRFADRSRLIPEPVEKMPRIDPLEARRRLQVPETGRYVGCAGNLDRRKGIDLLIRAFAAASRSEDDHLLLAGKVHPDIAHMLQSEYAALVNRNRIVVIDRFLSDDQMALVLSAMDVVIACYPRHVGSSGIVVRAPRIGRPLLGSSFGWVGFVIDRFSLGKTCNVLDSNAFSAAIADALHDTDDLRLGEAAERFLQYHTAGNYAAAQTARLRERLGKPATQNLRTWQWVNEPLEW